MSRRFVTMLLSLVGVAAVPVGHGAAVASAVRQDTVDVRTPVPLPRGARNAVLAEMRLMLGSVQGVLAGAVGNDRAAMRAAAAASGTAAAADPALARALPTDFLERGMATHRAFDALAAAIDAGAGADTAVAHLARVLSQCVACHATYRLVVR